LLARVVLTKVAQELKEPDIPRQVAFTHSAKHSQIALIGFRGSSAPALAEKRNSFLKLLKNKNCQEESRTRVGLYAIGTSTTLESNKSQWIKSS
jgi:hypothetical protein